MLIKRVKNTAYGVGGVSGSKDLFSTKSPESSLRSLNIDIQDISNYYFQRNTNYISETSFSTVPLRRASFQKAKCPSLLGFRALYCSERGYTTHLYILYLYPEIPVNIELFVFDWMLISYLI
jgi:hypothetical protein